MRRFVLTGPECSGKTTLSKYLAEHFRGKYLAEPARTILNGVEAYTPKDLLAILGAYIKRDDVNFFDAKLFLDTDLQNLFLWWQERYGPAPRKLFRAYKAQSERFFLLCKPDLPWIYDPLRENPIDRDRLFELYYRDLTQRGLPFAVIEGDGVERLELSIEHVVANV
jgi:nicotinamide riboside kinase